MDYFSTFSGFIKNLKIQVVSFIDTFILNLLLKTDQFGLKNECVTAFPQILIFA